MRTLILLNIPESSYQCANMLAVVACDRNAYVRRIDADLLCTLLSLQV